MTIKDQKGLLIKGGAMGTKSSDPHHIQQLNSVESRLMPKKKGRKPNYLKAIENLKRN